MAFSIVRTYREAPDHGILTFMECQTDNLSIAYRDPRSLTPSVRNSRTHTAKQIGQLAKSIKSFGFNNPILLDCAGQIIAGHGRALAAIELGLEHVPTVRLDHLSPAQKQAYIIADNKLAELAGWDAALLAGELRSLMDTELDFELTDIGFELPEIDVLIEADRDEDKSAASDDLGGLQNLSRVANLGDLWRLGDHLVLCGDALDETNYQLLLGGQKCQMVFNDPPYNVPVQGHISGPGNTKHPEFLMASGEMSRAEYTDFLARSFRRAADVSSDGALHFICMDWRHLGELLAAGNEVYSELKNLCVWVKSNGGMGSLYRSQHELVAVFKLGRGKHINNVELGKHGRSRTNVWQYPGMNGFHKDREATLAMHPTIKPVELVRDALYDCSNRGDLILDQFGGAGTTLIAAEKTGRRARLIELDPRYVDVTLQRFLMATGIMPVNVETGQTFGGASVSERRTQP